MVGSEGRRENYIVIELQIDTVVKHELTETLKDVWMTDDDHLSTATACSRAIGYTSTTYEHRMAMRLGRYVCSEEVPLRNGHKLEDVGPTHCTLTP